MNDYPGYDVHEDKIYNLLIIILKEYKQQLAELQLIPRISDIRRSGQGKKYRSELDVTFWEHTKFIDILEFFIIFDGERTSTEKEFKQWFLTNLNDILQRKKKVLSPL